MSQFLCDSPRKMWRKKNTVYNKFYFLQQVPMKLPHFKFPRGSVCLILGAVYAAYTMKVQLRVWPESGGNNNQEAVCIIVVMIYFFMKSCLFSVCFISALPENCSPGHQAIKLVTGWWRPRENSWFWSQQPVWGQWCFTVQHCRHSCLHGSRDVIGEVQELQWKGELTQTCRLCFCLFVWSSGLQ